MQLYVGSCHVVSAEIAVAMDMPTDNLADCEVRGVIRFLQANEILVRHAEEARSCVELFYCTTMHVRILPARHKSCCVSILEHPQLAPSDFFLFPKMKHHAGKASK